jgi:hypothetical protein
LNQAGKYDRPQKADNQQRVEAETHWWNDLAF